MATELKHDGAAFPIPGQRHQFEERYRRAEDPWGYRQRAVEVLRHERIARTSNQRAPRRVLEIGCALGDGTSLLRASEILCAIDVSPTAVVRARARTTNSPALVAASVTQLPFTDGTFDVIVASDGLRSWGLSAEQRRHGLFEIETALAEDGVVLLTEHLRPEQFGGFEHEIAAILDIESVIHCGDRLCYQLESALKAVRRSPFARAVLRNRALARMLMAIGRSLGPVASRHIMVIARRKPRRAMAR